MYFMGKLLIISNLESNQLSLIEKAIQSIEETIDEITIHYAYQIPANTDDVIKSHDEIKLVAFNKLNTYAEAINNKTGINTAVKLSLGSYENTLKRLLYTNDFNYVISNENKFDSALKTSFPKILFLDTLN